MQSSFSLSPHNQLLILSWSIFFRVFFSVFLIDFLWSRQLAFLLSQVHYINPNFIEYFTLFFFWINYTKWSERLLISFNVAQCGHHHFSGSQSSFLLFRFLWWNLHILPLFLPFAYDFRTTIKKISGKLLAIVSCDINEDDTVYESYFHCLHA